MSADQPISIADKQAKLSQLLAAAWSEAGGTAFTPAPVVKLLFDKMIAECWNDEEKMRSHIDRMAGMLNYHRQKMALVT